MNDPKDIVLIYRAADGTELEQPLVDVHQVGTLVDPDTGEDLEPTSWRFAEGQDYVLVEGGIVQTVPGIPVFDLDVLDADSYPVDTVAEVIALYEGISAHPHASRDWSSALQDAAGIVRGHGSPEQARLIDEQERARLDALAAADEAS